MDQNLNFRRPLAVALLLPIFLLASGEASGTALAAGRELLPNPAAASVTTRFPVPARAHLPGSTPVARTLALELEEGNGDAAQSTTTASTSPADGGDCGGGGFAVVFVASGVVDTTNSGAMRVDCVAPAPGGDVVLAGAGLDRALFVDVTSQDNQVLRNVPFDAGAGGANLLVRTASVACVGALTPFAPAVLYIGTSNGYLAVIGAPWTIGCSA